MIFFMNSMPAIERYRFGKMVIGGKPFTSDLMILSSGDIIQNWRRRKGHLLTSDDIKPLLDSQPDLLIVGTGAFGMMKMDPALDDRSGEPASGKKTKVIALRTGKGIESYNKLLTSNQKMCACFHLTC